MTTRRTDYAAVDGYERGDGKDGDDRCRRGRWDGGGRLMAHERGYGVDGVDGDVGDGIRGLLSFGGVGEEFKATAW